MESIYENLLNVLQTWWQSFVDNLPSLVAGLVIFLLSLYLAGLFARMTKRVMNRRKEDRELTMLITRIVRWVVVGLGIILALEQAGQDVTALLTGLGILGFTVGFALQDVSANLVSGILLLFEQPFDIGDSIDVAGFSGTVQNIEIRATEMLTYDGLLVLIPNREVFTNPITNYTRISQRRISLSVGIGYGSDLEEVERVVLDALNHLEGVKEEPEPYFMVDSFGDSAINTTAYYWYDTKSEGLKDMTNVGALAIKTALDKAGIDIPYPIRSVKLEQPKLDA